MFETFRNYFDDLYQDFKQDPTKYVLKKPYTALGLAANGTARATSQIAGFYVATLLFTEVAIVGVAGNFVAAGITLIPALAALHYSGPPFTIAKNVMSTALKPVAYVGKFAFGNVIDYCLKEYGFVDRIKNRPVGELFAASPLVEERENDERSRRNQSLAWNLIVDTAEFTFGPFRFSPSASFRYSFPYDLSLGLLNKIFYKSGLEDRARELHRERTQQELLAETRELVNFLRHEIVNNHIPSTQEETQMREQLKSVFTRVNATDDHLILPSNFIVTKQPIDAQSPDLTETGRFVIEARLRRDREHKLQQVVVTKPSEALCNVPQEITRQQHYKHNAIMSYLQHSIQGDQDLAKVQTVPFFESSLRRLVPRIANYFYADVEKAREQNIQNTKAVIESQLNFAESRQKQSEQRLNKAMLYMQTFDNRREAQQRLNELFTETKPKHNGAKTIRQKHEAVLEEIKQPRKKIAF
jgi:hypothetical protein